VNKAPGLLHSIIYSSPQYKIHNNCVINNIDFFTSSTELTHCHWLVSYRTFVSQQELFPIILSNYWSVRKFHLQYYIMEDKIETLGCMYTQQQKLQLQAGGGGLRKRKIFAQNLQRWTSCLGADPLSVVVRFWLTPTVLPHPTLHRAGHLWWMAPDWNSWNYTEIEFRKTAQ